MLTRMRRDRGRGIFLAALIGLLGSWLAPPASATEAAHFEFLTTALGPVRTLKVADGHVYAGVDNRLQVYDMTGRARAKLVHEADALHDHIADIAVEGARLYLAAETAGLVIKDRSDPAKPVFLGRVPGEKLAPVGVAAAGDIVYAACEAEGIKVVDVSDPRAPRVVATKKDGSVRHLLYRAPYLYAADSLGRFLIYDATVPTALTRLGAKTMKAAVQQIAVSGNLAYLAVGPAGLRIVDVSTPSDPVVIGSYVNSPGEDAVGVALSGSLALVADRLTKVHHTQVPGGLRVIDVRDPRNPVQKAFVRRSLVGVDAEGQRAYVGVRERTVISTIDAIDISRPDAPLRVMSAFLPFPDDEGVHASGNDILFPGYSLARLDLARPDRPHLRWTRQVAEVPPNERYGARGVVVVAEGMAHAFASPGTIKLIDVADMDRPKVRGTIALRGPAIAATAGYLYAKDYLYTADVGIYDVRDPDKPKLVGSLPDTGDAGRGFIHGHHFFLFPAGTSRHLLKVYDVAEPSAPVLVSTQDWAGDLSARQLIADRLYVAKGYDTQKALLVYSLLEAPALNLLGNWTLPWGTADSMTVCGTSAFFTSWPLGALIAADVSDPAAPHETARYVTPQRQMISSTCTDNNTVAVKLVHGLQVLRYVPTAN